mmetsp:Transcript_106874/g.148953  ORF Transcript_106874/g.148953 Transcript_106874/m.148953 type:complete len:98 (-) Transcript_106874:60-353(-)
MGCKRRRATHALWEQASSFRPETCLASQAIVDESCVEAFTAEVLSGLLRTFCWKCHVFAPISGGLVQLAMDAPEEMQHSMDSPFVPSCETALVMVYA